MTSTPAGTPRGRGLGRVTVYYVLLAGLLVAAVEMSPMVREALSGSPLSQLERDQLGEIVGPQAPPVGQVVNQTPWSGALLAAISMLGALAIMIPVTWVYIITRRDRGYHESVVHTLLILPIAVTGIVMIVQNDIALAFSLAGIVAAVRFRTTLEDTKDAVYVFLSIGVGISCGVQQLGIAFVLSLVFNAVVLVLWHKKFGNMYADPSIGLSRGDVLAGPASAARALQVGDPAILEAVTADDRAGIAERAARMERYISEERKKKKAERANQLVLVHATDAAAAQSFVDKVLDELATRYKLKEIGTGPAGVLLEYLASLDGPGVEGAVYDRLHEGRGGPLVGAELRSIKGLKPRA